MKRLGRFPGLLLISALASFLSACGDSSEIQDPLATTTLEDVQLVDPKGTANEGFPMLFDELGEPHIVYLRSDRKGVQYAYRGESGWSIENVVEGGDFLNGLSIGLNASQEPVLTYQRVVSPYAAKLEFAERVGGAWATDTVDADGWVGSWASMQVLPSGLIRLAYFAGYPNYDLRYAERESGQWITATIDTEQDAGYSAALASAPDGEPVILYSTFFLGLRFANRTAGVWTLQTLDSGGFGLSMAVDPSLRIHVAYPSSGGFKYATQNATGGWDYEPIEGTPQTARALVLDAAEESWYVGYNPRILRIGNRHNGRWLVKEFPEAGQIGNVTMATSPDGRLGLSFVTTGDSLFFAWIKP